MRTPRLSKNEILAKPNDSAVYNAMQMRLAVRLEQVLKKFAAKPEQDRLVTLFENLQSYLQPASVSVMIDAYKRGAKDVGMPVDKIKQIALQREAKNNASLAAHQVTNTTAKTFGLKYSFNAGLSKEQIASKLRSGNISKHQMDMNYLRGLRYGWSLNKLSRKRSFVHDDHDKDDICDDNEDAGAIDVDDAFPSGDFEPPFHFGCVCGFILVR